MASILKYDNNAWLFIKVAQAKVLTFCLKVEKRLGFVIK